MKWGYGSFTVGADKFGPRWDECTDWATFNDWQDETETLHESFGKVEKKPWPKKMKSKRRGGPAKSHIYKKKSEETSSLIKVESDGTWDSYTNLDIQHAEPSPV